MKKTDKLVLKKREINKKDLIVGIDIGSQFHSVVFQDSEGSVFKAYDKIYNSRKGFDYLASEIEKIRATNIVEKVHIGFEPTGHYWKTLIYDLNHRGYETHFIRTTAVKSQRELDDSSSSKTDITDANHIASLIREGKYIDSKIPEGVFQSLRDMGKLRARVAKMKTSALCRLRMLVEMYFPEIIDQFYGINSVGFWRLIKIAPFPEDIQKISEEELLKILSLPGMKKTKLIERVIKIKELSKTSIGLGTGEIERFNIKQSIATLELYRSQLKEIEKKMVNLLEETEYWELMDSIPGVGAVTAATLLGEMGDPQNFRNPKAIIKFAGVDPKEDSSGIHKSKLKISKKGRYLMRTMLYYISLRLVNHSEKFKNYYRNKLEKPNCRGRYLEKKEALFAVVIKFIKILFAMFRDKTMYVEEPLEVRLAA